MTVSRGSGSLPYVARSNTSGFRTTASGTGVQELNRVSRTQTQGSSGRQVAAHDKWPRGKAPGGTPYEFLPPARQ
eukprot:3316937-Amphidinium_carterae.1